MATKKDKTGGGLTKAQVQTQPVKKSEYVVTPQGDRIKVVGTTTTKVVQPAPVTKPTPPKPSIALPDSYSSLDKLQFLQLPAGEAKRSIRRYRPQEKLTGIITDTPEIISMVEFVPIVAKESSTAKASLTVAGTYLDQQITLRDMKMQNISLLIAELRKNSDVDELMKKRTKAYDRALDEVQSIVSFMIDAVLQLERARSYLDLRNDAHRVDPAALAASLRGERSFTSSGAKTSAVAQPYDIPSLLTQLGFTYENVVASFSSTKMWLQLLIEYKEMIRTHSLGLTDSTYVGFRSDKSAGTFVKPPRNRFDVSLLSTYALSEIATLQPNQLDTAIRGITNSYKNLYVNQQFKNVEHRLAAESTIVSRELRLSRGLAQSDVQLVLKEYGYTVAPTGNVGLLDAFIGQFGGTIEDFPVAGGNSLVNVAQFRHESNASLGVLTFEEKYVEGNNGTLTPGSEYFIDEVLKTDGTRFPTNNTKRLRDLTAKAHKNFKAIAVGLNLTMDPINVTSDDGDVLDEPYSNPRRLFDEIVKRFVDVNGKTIKGINDDPATAVFAAAQGGQNEELRTALFLLVMLVAFKDSNRRIAEIIAIRNDSTIDALAKKVDEILFRRYPFESASSVSKRIRPNETSRSVANTSIVDSLRQGSSNVLKTAAQIMSDYRSVLTRDVVTSGRTRYSGYADTIVMMVIFDMIIECIAKYGNKRIVGLVMDKRIRSIVIAQGSVNQTSSINDVRTRLNREATINQQVVRSILNTLSVVHSSTNSLITSLESEEWIAKLRRLSSIVVFNSMLQTMFTKQQIMSLASNVTDMKLSDAKQGANNRGFIDVDDDGDYDFLDDVRVLDDSVVSPKLRSALLGYFGDSQFSTQKSLGKRILTVGIPLGLSEHINQVTKLTSTNRDGFKDKQSDIVVIKVHRVDLQNPDVVFHPKEVLFELSRFPVRNVLEHPAFRDAVSYIEQFPTRDYSQQYETLGGASSVQYLRPNKGQTAAFDDDSYSFLTPDQRRQIVKNVVESYLIEVYVRLMTGFHINDRAFVHNEPRAFIDAEFSRELTNAIISSVGSQPQGESPADIFFPGVRPRPIADITKRITDKAVNLATFDQVKLEAVAHRISVLDALSRTLTPLASPDVTQTTLLAPAKFDRIVSMMIDPDDFIVDTTSTMRSSEGRDALARLTRSGELTIGYNANMGLGRAFSTTERIVRRLRDTRQGDISLDKYLVTINTFGENVT